MVYLIWSNNDEKQFGLYDKLPSDTVLEQSEYDETVSVCYNDDDDTKYATYLPKITEDTDTALILYLDTYGWGSHESELLQDKIGGPSRGESYVTVVNSMEEIFNNIEYGFYDQHYSSKCEYCTNNAALLDNIEKIKKKGCCYNCSGKKCNSTMCKNIRKLDEMRIDDNYCLTKTLENLKENNYASFPGYGDEEYCYTIKKCKINSTVTF